MRGSREAALGSGSSVDPLPPNTPSISTRSPQSSLAPFVHRRKPHSKEELEPQCADIPSPKHSPSSSVSSQSLLVVCLNGDRRSTCALLEVSSSTFRRLLAYSSCPSLCPHYYHNHTPLIPDVGYSKQRLEELGLVMVSEGVLNGDIHTATYSMSQNTTFPKRDTTPEKPRDLQGHQCSITCRDNKGEKPPGVDDCKSLYNNTQSTVLTFTVEPGTSPSLPQDYDTKLTDAWDRSSF